MILIMGTPKKVPLIFGKLRFRGLKEDDKGLEARRILRYLRVKGFEFRSAF